MPEVAESQVNTGSWSIRLLWITTCAMVGVALLFLGMFALPVLLAAVFAPIPKRRWTAKGIIVLDGVFVLSAVAQYVPGYWLVGPGVLCPVVYCQVLALRSLFDSGWPHHARPASE